MDEMNLIYLVLILFLLKEIIRISNKKDNRPHSPVLRLS